MEIFFEKGEMMSASVQIFVLAFIRVILEDIGGQMDEGIILIADDMLMARHFIKAYVAKVGNGTVIDRKMPKTENYELGFKIVNTGMKEEQAEEFLGKEDFLPVLVTGGVLPSYLRTQHFFLRIRETDMKVLDDVNFQVKMQGLKAFIIENINVFIEDTQKAVNENKPYVRTLLYIENLLSQYYQRYYELKKEEADEMVDELGKFTEKLLKTSEDIIHANGDVREEISDRFFQFVATNQELVMLDVKGEMIPMISKDKVIWFDDEYYYLTDAMLRKVCGKVLELVSVNELKAILREEGILYCDASGDYSIKIVVKTQNGEKRPRVLKLRKLYLTVDGECLEDIYQERESNDA